VGLEKEGNPERAEWESPLPMVHKFKPTGGKIDAGKAVEKTGVAKFSFPTETREKKKKKKKMEALPGGVGRKKQKISRLKTGTGPSTNCTGESSYQVAGWNEETRLGQSPQESVEQEPLGKKTGSWPAKTTLAKAQCACWTDEALKSL